MLKTLQKTRGEIVREIIEKLKVDDIISTINGKPVLA